MIRTARKPIRTGRPTGHTLRVVSSDYMLRTQKADAEFLPLFDQKVVDNRPENRQFGE